MRRSASLLWNSIISGAPPGKAFRASAWSSPRSLAAARSAASLHPSKAAWAATASISFSRKPSRSVTGSILDFFLAMVAAHLLGEHELRKIGHAHGVENAVQMVAFMLHQTGVEIFCFPFDHEPFGGDSAIENAGIAGDLAGEAGHRKTGFPAVRHLLAQGLDHGIDEDRGRDRRRLLPLRPFGRDMKDDHALGDMDLGRCQPRPAHVQEGLPHVGDEGLDLRRRGIGDRLGRAAEDRVAHTGDLQDSHGSSWTGKGAGIQPGRPWRATRSPPPLLTDFAFGKSGLSSAPGKEARSPLEGGMASRLP